MSVSSCLVEGGDDRLLVIPSLRMNKYNVPNVPTAGVCRGSCTSSAPSANAFAIGEGVLDRLREVGASCFAGELRKRLRNVWGLDEKTSVTLFPSGTDVEFLFVLLALGRALELETGSGQQGGRVLSVVTCAGEVGSGTTKAAAGQHFSSLLPSGAQASAGTSIFESKPDVVAVEVKLRDSGGHLRPEKSVDAEIEALVTEALGPDVGGNSGYDVCCVHLVAGCKTGHSSPSLDMLERLRARFGNRLLPLFDGCQARLRDGILQEYVQRGFGVMVTGSKFYGGPPFSGAALMNVDLTRELNSYLRKPSAPLRELVLQSELRQYLSNSLVEVDSMPELCELLVESESIVRGTLLRWAMALVHIEEYHDIPGTTRDVIIGAWAAHVQSLVQKINSPALSVLDEQALSCSYPAGVLETNSIVSLCCRVKTDGEYRDPTIDELRHVHRLMALDLSDRCRLHGREVSAHEAERCFIAQPVALGKDSAPVLRVAIGAHQVCKLYERHAKLEQCWDISAVIGSWQDAEDEALLRKLASLLEQFGERWSATEEAQPSAADILKYDFHIWDQRLTWTVSVQELQHVLQTMHRGDCRKPLGEEQCDRLIKCFLRTQSADVNALQVEYEPFVEYLTKGV